MIIAWVPVLVLIVGLLMWALPSPPLIKDAGRIMFCCGLLVTLFTSAHTTVTLLGREVTPCRRC